MADLTLSHRIALAVCRSTGNPDGSCVAICPIQDGWKALERKQDPQMWPPMDPEKVAAALAVGRELRMLDV